MLVIWSMSLVMRSPVLSSPMSSPRPTIQLLNPVPAGNIAATCGFLNDELECTAGADTTFCLCLHSGDVVRPFRDACCMCGLRHPDIHRDTRVRADRPKSQWRTRRRSFLDLDLEFWREAVSDCDDSNGKDERSFPVQKIREHFVVSYIRLMYIFSETWSHRE